MPQVRTHPSIPPAATLGDGHGRRFAYLRLSLTERCNFRCSYCLPHGFRKRADAEPELTLPEIVRAVRGFATLGLWKVRLTGGEPTVRRDFAAIARAVAAVPGVRRLAMTTNGYRLAEHAAEWRAAGIDAVNVSVDSFDPERFAAVTGHDRLGEVLAGIAAAKAAGFASVKLNAVLMRGVNDDDLAAAMDFVAEHDVALRFIEVMRTNDNSAFFAARHVAATTIVEQLVRAGWHECERAPGAGPAREFANPSGRGRIGVIAPYADGFCASCNRLRLGSDGRFHTCLFGEGGASVRDLLQADDQHDALVARIVALTAHKAAGHRLHENHSGATAHFAAIGG